MLVNRVSSQIFAISVLLLVPHLCVYAEQGENTGGLWAKIIVRVRKRRAEFWDFTQLNRNICPPSLCRMSDEKSGQVPPRPRGTGGTVFYQGDIVLDKTMSDYIYPASRYRRRGKRATMRLRKRLWKKGEVPYRVARGISSEAKKVIERAIGHAEKRTCIKFIPKRSRDKDFVRFISEPGCWSQVGRVGGAQMISLGRGCENMGTAVHEIVHALGAWHEQARSDRDKYVKILEDNISDKFKPDFEKVGKRIGTSRGYPYDYVSLVHYSKYAFTRNGEPTIKVIGIGEKLGLRIGQRRALSTIDIAQLRDMYKCNQRKDSEESVCHKGWRKYGTTCYKFFVEKQQFGSAHGTCRDMNSHLVMIESKREQKHLNSYLHRKFPTVMTWRIGGRRVGDRMVWYIGEGSVRNITKYSNWADGHPATYTSAIIRKNPRTNEFEWEGEWMGSASQKPAFEHAYICEKDARRKCVEGTHADGRNYRGDLDHTRDGFTCQKWTENYPHNHSLVTVSKAGAEKEGGEDGDGLGDHNKCRNPSVLRRNRPWCFTSKKKHEWGYCDVSICAKSIAAAQRQARLVTQRRMRERRWKHSGTSSSSSKRRRQSPSLSSSSSSRRYSRSQLWQILNSKSSSRRTRI